MVESGCFLPTVCFQLINVSHFVARAVMQADCTVADSKTGLHLLCLRNESMSTELLCLGRHAALHKMERAHR